ncbi:unnamed protein product [Arabis nemorensis]|uniref:Uncharacterized protein n=1 Tax=Arabis nemorensis TaxID=586526 RepID=A0A565B890_9BRAS|nr:unnamed protein product [Arabis nemorensis]
MGLTRKIVLDKRRIGRLNGFKREIKLLNEIAKIGQKKEVELLCCERIVAKTNEKLSCQVLEVEKRNGEDLKASKMTETTVQELDKVKIERQSFLTAKTGLEKSETAFLEKDLVEPKIAMDALKTELDSVGMDAKQSLVMLKSTASIVSQSDNREASFIGEQQEPENGTKSFTLELKSKTKRISSRK